MSELTVNLGERSYKVFFSQGLFEELPNQIEKLNIGTKALIITNQTVMSLYGEEIHSSIGKSIPEYNVVYVPDGEEAKNLGTVHKLYDQCINFGLERNSTIIAFGGGVVGDVAGFIAATYMRGINFIQIPTTLLAQVDSSIGGKVGINHPKGKNLIGAFYQPSLVYVSVRALNSLPMREVRAGLAEIIKYGVIYSSDLFQKMEENTEKITSLDHKIMENLIYRSCDIKRKVVAQDEREVGVRAILNFGHTIGHAIEAVSDYSLYRHGEAVALGMLVAGHYAKAAEYWDESNFKRLQNLMYKLELPYRLPKVSVETLVTAMYRDKKVKNGKLTMVLPRRIGEVFVIDNIDINRLKNILEILTAK
ncbi:3-dehydroquinate synthase [Desulfitispora alkaliphila]|uniref:3-dehydroquinate synthase n=1 Tax=Desulfitispora alkaliphila TaxID=622674 RepID=UPI003D198EAE